MPELQLDIPDIIVDLYLYPTEEGGLKRSITPVTFFGCPFFFEDKFFECRLLIHQTGQTLIPGITAVVQVKFLCPELIKPRLERGSRFKVWEGGFIGEGTVLDVLQ